MNENITEQKHLLIWSLVQTLLFDSNREKKLFWNITFFRKKQPQDLAPKSALRAPKVP